jgi:hypothetical protein
VCTKNLCLCIAASPVDPRVYLWRRFGMTRAGTEYPMSSSPLSHCTSQGAALQRVTNEHLQEAYVHHTCNSPIEVGFDLE